MEIIPAVLTHVEAIQDLSFKHHFLNHPNEMNAIRDGFTGVVLSKKILSEIISENLSKVIVINGELKGYFLFCSPKVYQKAFGLSFNDFLHKYHVAPAPDSVYAVEAFVEPKINLEEFFEQIKDSVFGYLSEKGYGVSFTEVPQNNSISIRVHSKLGYRFLSAQEADLWCDFKGDDKDLLKKLKRSATTETVVWNLYKKAFA